MLNVAEYSEKTSSWIEYVDVALQVVIIYQSNFSYYY